MIIGVCGGTASGKTIFAKKILEIVGSNAIIYLEHDAYYKGLDELPPELQKEKNFDHPDSLDNELFISRLNAQSTILPNTAAHWKPTVSSPDRLSWLMGS
jgi:uridine kinase